MKPVYVHPLRLECRSCGMAYAGNAINVGKLPAIGRFITSKDVHLRGALAAGLFWLSTAVPCNESPILPDSCLRWQSSSLVVDEINTI